MFPRHQQMRKASASWGRSAPPDTYSLWRAGGVLKKGEKLFLEQKVNPALIGGFVIDIGMFPCALLQL